MKTKIVSLSGRSVKTLKVIAGELRRIQTEQSVITPQAVVEAAKPKASPLHRYFEWNDSAAAENYRRWQARELILSVHIVDADNPESGPVRAFVNVNPEKGDDFIGGKGYVFTPTIATRASYQAQVLQYAYQQLLAWKQKFGGFKEFFPVTKAIDRVKV